MQYKISTTAEEHIATYIAAYVEEGDWSSRDSIRTRRANRIEAYRKLCNYIIGLEKSQVEAG